MRTQALPIRTILLCTISALTLLIVTLAALEMYFQWEKLVKIRELKKATILGDRLFDLAEKISIERDITYFMLHTPDEVVVESLRERLKNDRQETDRLIKIIAEEFSSYNLPDPAGAHEQSVGRFQAIQNLRLEVDKTTGLPAGERDGILAKHWFDETTALILQTQVFWMEFIEDFINVDQRATRHMRFKHNLAVIMEYTGRERSLIGRLIVQNVNPSPEEQAQLLRWQGKIETGWESGDIFAKQSELYPAILPHFKDAESHYFTLHDMVGNIIYDPDAQKKTSYPIGIDLWLELAAQATDSFYALKNAALVETQNYVEILQMKAERQILFYSLGLLLALALCSYSFWVILYRVLRPIHVMVKALFDTIQGKAVNQSLPSLNRDDEIGQLAQVLHAFQQSAEKARQSAANLERSENKLRAVVDHTLDGLITIDTHGKIESFNLACEKIFGYSAQEVIGQNVKMLMPEPYHSEHDGYLRHYVSTGEAHIIGTAGREVRAKRKDGSIFPMDLSISAFNLEDGQHFSGIIRDITARKAAEEEIKNSANRLKAVFDTVLDGLISINNHGIIQSFNAAAEGIFGYKAKEVIGQNVNMLMPEPYHSEHDGYLSNYLRTGKAKIIGIGREVRARRRDGSIFPMELGISAFKIGEETAFVGIIRDITTRKEVERHLQESKDRTQSIIEHALDAVVATDQEGKITEWNQQAEIIFGWQREEAIGIPMASLIIPHQYRAAHHDGMQKFLADGTANILNKRIEITALNKKGAVFPVELAVTTQQVHDTQHFTAFIRDITERKRAEEEREKLIKNLERSNKELDDFAYIASHDLKEPLRGLFNNAKFLKEDYQDKLDQSGNEILSRLGYLSQRMETLVNDLLYFSRLGRQDLAIQKTDLNEIIKEIESLMETTIKEENVIIEIPEKLPVIVCDKPRITEVFRNLITNAVKYNNKPKKIISVGYKKEVQTENGAEKDVFFVKDNGIGIEKEFYEEVFRIFKRLNEEEDSKKGTGVGLTFVKKIVERHGGRIWLESEIGKGTIFYFTIRQGDNYDSTR